MWDQVKKKKKPLIPVKKGGGGGDDAPPVDVPGIDDVMSKANAAIEKAKKAEAAAAKQKEDDVWDLCRC